MTDVSKTVDRQRLAVGITGASGVVYGLRTLDALRDLGVESHLVLSKSAALTLAQEAGLSVAEVNAKADVVHRAADVGASIASGSFRTLGMIVAPCSVRTMSEIATGVTSSLLTRAADVTLKERRPLLLVVRETPLHVGHCRLLLDAATAGATIMPPVPSFYTRPATIDDIVDHTVGRILDHLDIDSGLVKRWREQSGPGTPGMPDGDAGGGPA